MNKLIFGCGYLGERVARRWRAAGHNIGVVTRSPGRAEYFQKQGLVPIVADVTRPGALRQFIEADTVLYSVGFDRTIGKSIDEVYAGGVRNVLAALPARLLRFIYISTTGVYGPADGGWVDEATPPDPRREGGRASLAAEQALVDHPVGRNGTILRLAGLYGPGRVPFIRELREGKPIPAPASGWLNLIHVEDAADVVIAADDLQPFENGPRIYCVSDGNPVERGEYYSEAARQISAPPPRFVAPDSASPRAARAESNRRVSNARMLADLRVTLKYPDYRAGLASAVERWEGDAPAEPL
jgi:nucleoside-diphosphate-sugar epimerase